MMMITSNPGRLGVLLLFAMLSLLPAQSALADCLAPSPAVPEAAAACCHLDSGFTAGTETDRATLAMLCERVCASPTTPKSGTLSYAAPHHYPAWLPDRPAVAYTSSSFTPGPRWFINDPPDTRQRIHHFQRLLI